GLADELTFAFRRFGDGFTIGDLRCSGIGADFELAEQAITNDFQMELSHARDNELSSLLVREAAERRVFFSETLKAFAHFLTIGLGFWLDGHGNHWLWKRRRLEQNLQVFIAKCIARGNVLQTNQRGDIPGISRLHIDAFIGLDHHDPAHAFTFSRSRIVNNIALFELPAIDTKE